MRRTDLEKSRILAKRVRAKTLKRHLIKRLQDKFDICEAESEAIAHKTLQYLDTKLGDTRRYNQVIVDGYELKKEDIKGKFRSLKIRLTYYDDSDLEVEERYGKDGARYNRVIRWFEEAYSQGGALKATTIALVLGASRKMISKIVRYYRILGVRVELRRQHKKGPGGCYRDVKAIELLLEGTEKEEALKRLFMGPTSLRDALDELALVGELKERGFNSGEIGKVCHLPAQKVKEYEELWKKHRGNSAIPRREVESDEYIQEYGEAVSRNSLSRELSQQYDFSPGAVRLFFNEIDGFERELKAEGLRENEVIYYAVREEVGAGRAIAECRLVPVRLSIYGQEDGRGFVGDSSPDVERVRTRMIKEARINRWAIETKQGCGLLSLEDVSYLLGLHSTSISLILKGLRQRGIDPPLRGAQKDMGKGVSHEVKAIEYYLMGYAEDVIAKKLHHGLDQLLEYQKRFRQVMWLKEDGYSDLKIHILSGISEKKVKDLVQLYESNKEKAEFQQKLSWLRDLGNNGEKKGGEGAGDED